MKISLILLSLLALSCGKIDIPGGSSSLVGESRSINAFSVLSDSDRNNLQSVCNAFSSKGVVLSNSVGASFNFSTTMSDCSQKKTSELNVETILASNGSSFVFKRKDNNQDFIFADAETNVSGVLADFCSQFNSIQNPVVSGLNASYVTTSGISGTDCTQQFGEICVSVEKASQQGDQYVVHTKEWLRVRISSTAGDRIGFVTQRKKVTRGPCGSNEVLEFQALLK
jgi:hypothetical protein